MSTRGNVGILEPDGRFIFVFTHWDNYPSGTGANLLIGFSKEKKVRELIALGDLSVVGVRIGKQHPFDRRTAAIKNWDDYRKLPEVKNEWCVSYKRDRGEKDTDAKTYASFAEYVRMEIPETWAEYLYVFDVKKGKWYFSPISNKELTMTLKPLTLRAIEKNLRHIYGRGKALDRELARLRKKIAPKELVAA
jgi:hypothetical protein